MEHKLFTIIVTFNGERWIKKTLTSLRSSSIQSKVIIVDNNSEDNTCEIIKNEFPEVELIKSPKNVGFGQANNKGINHVLNLGAEYVFLLNQDAYVKENTLEKLLKAFSFDNQLGIVSPVHLNGEGSQLDYGFKHYMEKYSDVVDLQSINLYESNRVVFSKFINAAAWMLNRRCLEIVGGFNPVFYHYGEDNDYINRLHYHKLKLAVASGAIICHDRKQEIDFSNIDKNTYREKVAFLKIITNINLTSIEIFFKVVNKILRELTYYIIHKEWKKGTGLFLGFFNMMKLLPSVGQKRKFSSKKRAYL